MRTLKDRILGIDSRIKYCEVEVDEEDFYAKIWFNWEYKSLDKFIPYGRFGKQEFESLTEEDLLEQIRAFSDKKHETFIIV